MLTIDFPIRDSKKPHRFKLPDHCVHCGKPKAETLPVKLNAGVQKSGRMIQIEMDVPLCATKENRIANVTWIPFFVVGLLTCSIVFIPVWLLSPEGTSQQTYAFPYVLAAFVGMIAGIIFGTLVEFTIKMFFARPYGRLLMNRPLTVLSIFNDSESIIGLSTTFTDGRKTLKLNFENDEIAREFAALNPQENG